MLSECSWLPNDSVRFCSNPFRASVRAAFRRNKSPVTQAKSASERVRLYDCWTYLGKLFVSIARDFCTLVKPFLAGPLTDRIKLGSSRRKGGWIEEDAANFQITRESELVLKRAKTMELQFSASHPTFFCVEQ